MAMVILVLQVRLASRLACLFLPLLLLACDKPNHDSVKEAVRLKINKLDTAFAQHANTLLYKREPFTGVVFLLNKNNDTTFREVYVLGRQENAGMLWYDNGGKREERWYTSGKRTGIHQGWYENGQLKFRYHYQHDLMHGPAEEWYEDGTPYKKMHYAEGHEAGMQKAWSTNGQLKINYEARNGRNYGLTGVKLCKNVWNSTSISH
jgi:antitoxin component YwqK of YwqJK toxin-antitoxin module